MADTAPMQQPLVQQSLMQKALHEIRDLRAKLSALERSREEPIAIVGMGCRFPGGADSPERFWELLRDGVDAIGPVPPDRWDVDEFYDPNPGTPGKMYVREGGFLSDTDSFDPQFFGISPREADWMDPQQRLLLEVCQEALERAGTAPDTLAGKPTGVFVGISSFNYATHILSSFEGSEVGQFFGTGNALSVAAGRLSYTLGLTGPSLAIDTACSSSLVAVHLACESLRRGECEMALAGGVGLILTPDTTVNFCRAGMISRDGRCKTFAAGADGYVRSEGAGMIVLKRLTDAVGARDRVVAVVRGSACNHDGRSTGLTVPNRTAQREVIRTALRKAGIAPGEVAYVEAHGTGTSLGDPIELGALADVFPPRGENPKPLLLGSVKTNLGHLEAAAGIAGVIKVALAMQHGTIPAHLHFDRPTPNFDWAHEALQVVCEATPWPAERSLAGVSSFGFSGTNAHVVMERASMPQDEEPAADRPLHIYTLSARSEAALRESTARHMADSDRAAGFANRCFTANAGRSHFAHRMAVVTGSAAEMRRQVEAGEALRGHAESAPRCAFLFTGQGSQYAGMGRELCLTHPGFRRTLENCDDLLRAEFQLPLMDLLYGAAGTSERLTDTAVAQPLLFAVEYALAELWRGWGVEPAVVMGHSLGEYTAACIAGVFDWKAALRLVAVRGQLMSGLPREGEMAAVLADPGTVEEFIRPFRDDVSVGSLNGPRNVVISGRRAAMREVTARLNKAGIVTRPLPVSHAFHSPMMDPILREFEETAARVPMAAPAITLISNLTGQPFGADEAPSAAYWSRHLRQPVDFAGGLLSLDAEGVDTLIEVGPGTTLCGMARRECLPSLRNGAGDWATVLGSLAAFYVRGGKVDWEAFDGPWARRKVSLPTYPFERRRCSVGTGSRAKPPRTDSLPALLYTVEWQTVEWQTLDALAGPTLPTHLFTATDDDPAEQCARLTAFVRKLAAAGTPGKLWIVTSGAAISARQAPLRGLARVIAIEHPGLYGGTIDIDSAELGFAVSADLVASVPAGENELRLRGSEWYASRLRCTGPSGTGTENAVHAGCTYLITGGLGMIGLRMARELAGLGATNLVLLGRSEGSAAAAEAVRQLRAKGVSVHIERADAADRSALGMALDRIALSGAPLRGIVHAAGVLEDALVTAISREQLDRVFRPKAVAAWALHELTADLPLDFFVLCSSAASVLGAGGQGAYAAANASLDALAQYRHSLGLPAVAFNWGPWAGAGMGAEVRNPAIRPIPPDVGAALFARNLKHAAAQVVAIDADWPLLAEQLPGRVPPILKELLKDSNAIGEQLARLPGARHREFLTGWVQTRVARVLGLAPGNLCPIRQGFFEMGFDSLLTLELRNNIQAELPISLPATLTFEYATVADLAGYLERALAAHDHAETPKTTEQPTGQHGLREELELLEEVLVRH